MKFLFSIIILFLLTVSVAGATSVSSGTCRGETGGYCLNLAAAGVPGLEFLTVSPDAKTGDVLGKIFVFGLGIVALSALIMLVFGGVLYMTAGDSQDRLKQARTHIGNAVFGLVVALLAWLALNTINPNLVKNIFPELEQIKPVAPPGGTPGAAGEPTLPPGTTAWVCDTRAGERFLNKRACDAGCNSGPCTARP